jgi:hypothetical protein
MEETTQGNEGKAKQWLQDNLRIITSIIIVLVIALGIYSYSKKTQVPGIDELGQVTQENTTGQTPAAVSNDNTTPGSTTGTQAVSAPSQETEGSFIETAIKGDGTTRLARRALANYLEKNPNSTLTAEHKIYIEDFLRKNVPQKRVFVGTSVEFSKSLIQDAITKSMNLNDKQLQNLHKYAVRVPSLT